VNALSTSLGPTLLPPAMGLLVLVLGAYVCIDIGQRVRHRAAAERLPWLLASAVALATGLWATAVLRVADSMSEIEFGFDGHAVGAATLAAFALGLPGLHWALSMPASPLKRLGGAAFLGGAALATQMLALSSVAQPTGLQWNIGLLMLAWLSASSGFGWGLRAADVQMDAEARLPRQVGAALVVGTGTLVAQTLAMASAALPAVATPLSNEAIPPATVVMLASMGGAQLLLLMLLACTIELRMRRRLEKARLELAAHALRDELTGLPNRQSFEGRLAQAQRTADAQQVPLALLVVALDGFKHINDAFGHECGDRLLQRIAQRLRGLVTPHSAARLGSDEFLLLLQGEASAQQAMALAVQVIDAVSQPCNVNERELNVSCSVGLALYPQHGSMSALITHAGVAMRAAKSAGGSTYAVFDARMVVDTREQAELLRDLRLALARSQLELFYQPKVHAPSAQITGVEALLRWHHPQRGTISPNIFIPIAERSGLINAMGAWVIDEACRQARVWRDGGLRMRVAVNLSAHQLRQRDLPQRIAAALRKHQINPDLLTCEITESVAMEDTEATLRFFSELAAVGVHISIDDFGSGYSSLAYLRKLPAGELKIDRSFVLDLEHSEQARKIAMAVVQLAQALKLKVVAEGVETDEQYQILRQLGCDELQGFLFAKPMSAKALGLWAMADEGPRAIQFRESLFKETQAMAL
jgi:diguanylate cyclase (GGDEF)-like protein